MVCGAEHENNLVLGSVGVLILVNEDVLKLMLIVGQHVWKVTKKSDRVHEEIVEVHGASPFETQLVFLIGLSMTPIDDVLGRIECRGWRNQFVLPETDVGLNSLSWELAGIKTHIAHDITCESFAVRSVVDTERLRVTDLVGVRTQHAHATLVKGGDPHAASHRTNQHRDSFLHLVCGLVGERDGQDVHGMYAVANEPCDPLGENAGFP